MTIDSAVNVGRRSRPSSTRERISRAQAVWHDADPRTRVRVQVAALLGSVVIAYNYSLTTLIQNAGLTHRSPM